MLHEVNVRMSLTPTSNARLYPHPSHQGALANQVRYLELYFLNRRQLMNISIIDLIPRYCHSGFSLHIASFMDIACLYCLGGLYCYMLVLYGFVCLTTYAIQLQDFYGFSYSKQLTLSPRACLLPCLGYYHYIHY